MQNRNLAQQQQMFNQQQQQQMLNQRQQQMFNQQQRMPGPEPEDNGKKGKKKKSKKDKEPNQPVTTGKAFVMGLLGAFIIFLLFGGALIAFNIISSKNDAKIAQSYLDQMQQSIDDQSLIVNITPAESAVNQALASNANIKAYASNDVNSTVTNGAGVVVSEDGNILTNYHVIENSPKIVVTIAGTDYPAEVVSSDVTSDLSLLKIEAKNLSVPEPLLDLNQSRTGQWVMTVGNPYGQSDSFTPGYISAFHRNMTYSGGTVDMIYANMIQLSMNINPGNSGGGLYNERGQLIGIITLVASASNGDTGNTGIGYAIPISYALGIAKDLLNKAPASHASAGMTVSNVPQDQIDKYKLPDSKGAYVDSVMSSGAGGKAGIAIGDVVVKFDGETVENGKDFDYKVRASEIGSEHQLLVLRGGKEMEVTISLGSDNNTDRA